MKPILFLFISLSCATLFSCSKKDSTPDQPVNKETKIKISNQSDYDLKVVAVSAITGTTRQDIAKDTTTGTRKVFNLGALKTGSTSKELSLDAKFKSLVIVFVYHNPVLGNKDYNAVVTKLSNGTNMLPYVFKTKTTFTVTLDKGMKFELI